jgi:hypothetical protein
MEVLAITKSKKKIPKSFRGLNNCACDDCKEAEFVEQCRTEDQRRNDALGALHERLSLEDRERAYKWTTIYRGLVDRSDTE